MVGGGQCGVSHHFRFLILVFHISSKCCCLSKVKRGFVRKGHIICNRQSY